MILGYLQIDSFLNDRKGLVTGCLVTDAKDRQYRQTYDWERVDCDKLRVRRRDGKGDEITVSRKIALDTSLVAFFGLYSGDGAKGTEDPKDSRRIIPTIAFSQREPHLVRFAVDQFRKLFPEGLRFTFSLGEDSAYFMAGEGKELLETYYRSLGLSGTPTVKPLSRCRPEPNKEDYKYLSEIRHDVPGSNEEYLAFYYTHKAAMEEILAEIKRKALEEVGIDTEVPDTRVTASLRRPFKKGARLPGGSSRSDEIHIGGLNGLGELFLKMLYEIEDSILCDSKWSSSGLVEWADQPSKIGESLDLREFFKSSLYGVINNGRPVSLDIDGLYLVGQWPQSKETRIAPRLRIDPLWCYTSGLYLAEGATNKTEFFAMFTKRPKGLSLAFTSSEGTSIELMLRTLMRLFPCEVCVNAWKVKVGSQYFPELVVDGMKHGVAMLRGGSSGDGKLRTMEISLDIKEWALDVADVPLGGSPSLLRTHYADKYSHVEPTGAGVARIDFWASSTLCRWFFPLVMHTVFKDIVEDPAEGFY